MLLAPAVALIAATSFVGCSADDEPSTAGEPAAAATPTPQPSSPAEIAPDEFCDLFLTFVDANSEFSAKVDEVSGRVLLDAARTMFELPTPTGMSPGARVSLDELVAGTLDQLSEVPSVEVDTAPDPANAGEADPGAFDAYLQDTCPA